MKKCVKKHPQHTWVKPLAIAGGVALASAAVGYAYVELMTSVVARRRNEALSRVVTKCTTPKKKAKPSPNYDYLKDMAEEVKALPTRPVSIQNSEGMTLKAHYYPAANPKRLLILVHGWHSEWYKDFCASAPFFHESDCDLLMIEQRCHGESDGKYISYGVKERYDILDWLTWAETHLPRLPVYLCGLSMGATTVLMAAGLPIEGRVRGIVADCGYTSPHDIIQTTLKKTLKGASSPTLFAVEMNCRIKGNFRMDEYSALDAMAQNTNIPVLFIHGDADDFVPCVMTLENFEACQAPKEIFIVPGAGHGLAYVVDPEGYKKRVLNFFAKYDTPCKE